MATLVLTAVGTALGGPLGGALGGLVGQSIDQGLFGGGMRRGPRLGDLAVQTSSFGSAIPRIYGRMRVAGTVIWATDLKEEEAIEGGGKGSPERLSYRYSVSLAVALSSRPIRAIGRVWADGKLIRGAGGEFTVRTVFRTMSGSEDQPVDPLIASVETIARTPAYRGLALAIFEGLELGEFGNRIPVLTFEVEADAGPIEVGDLLGDASRSLIDVSGGRSVGGYAAHGSSIGDSVRPLIELGGLRLVERGGKLIEPAITSPILLGDHELGCDADGKERPAVERMRASHAELPSSQTLAYYDPDREYQAGQMRASSGDGGAVDVRTELPAVLTAGEAKQWVEQALVRRWQAANSVRLRLPPPRIGTGPGDFIQLPGSSRAMTVTSAEIEGMAVVVEAESAPPEIAPLPADPGRSVPDPDVPVGRSELAMFELPALGDAPESMARLYLAASNAGRWKALPVELWLGPEPIGGQALFCRSIQGVAETQLHDRSPCILDELSSVAVRLTSSDQVLLNADADSLAAGANLAMIGDELIQFGQAEPLAAGQYRLSRLLRGRRGTEWAAASHAAGEHFCLFDAAALAMVELSAGSVGARLRAVSHGIGDVPPLPEAWRTVRGEAMRPLPVCHLHARREGAELHLSWVRRSHLGWAWNDGVAVPPDSFPERYRLTLVGPAAQLECETDTAGVMLDVSSLPAEPGQTLEIRVQTIGPMALSRARIIRITM